jgi:quercetin dioxygenase-like cupin family protein
LARIARVLGVRLGTLLDDESIVGPVVVRKDAPGGNERFRSVTNEDGEPALDYLSLAAGKSGRHMDPFLVMVEPASRPPLSSHEGEEFVYVMEGAISLEYGKESYALGAGDSIYYDSIVEHRILATGTTPARLLSVLYAPS